MRTFVCVVAVVLAAASPVFGQALSHRGFVDLRAALFPQEAPRDSANVVGDALLREELFARPAPWLQVSAGVDVRGNSHDQVEQAWRVDIGDRRVLRPAISVRRLGATLTRGPLTLDLGRQFIRWGKADIVTPTDRFAPRDFINVIDSAFLGVTGARAVVQTGSDTFDVVWVPRFTPSRLPLLDQRWTVVPDSAAGFTLFRANPVLPTRDQVGFRWGHTGPGFELSASVFDGFNHQPSLRTSPTPGATPGLMVLPIYPRLRSYGVDAAVPTRWFTLKGEAATFQARDAAADDYVLYVVQVERQVGEWLLLAGYAGEVVTERRAAASFSPDRGLTKSAVARVSYTIDSNRSLAIEGAARTSGDGVYVKAEFSQARGQHWRATLAGVGLAGREDDFLGQYRRNSNVTLSLRYSF